MSFNALHLKTLYCHATYFQVIETRMNSMFELATQDEIDKLKAGDSSSANKSSEELQLDDLEVQNYSEV